MNELEYITMILYIIYIITLIYTPSLSLPSFLPSFLLGGGLEMMEMWKRIESETF